MSHFYRYLIIVISVIEAFEIMYKLYTKSSVEVAFRHFAHIILMKKFALISFLTKTSKPMFTHNSFVSTDMTERAVSTTLASVDYEEMAHRSYRF